MLFSEFRTIFLVKSSISITRYCNTIANIIIMTCLTFTPRNLITFYTYREDPVLVG